MPTTFPESCQCEGGTTHHHVCESPFTAQSDLAFAATAFPPLPGAAARKAPRLCSGIGYPIRWRCRRLHITRGHIAHQNLIVPVSPRISARLADCRHCTHRAGNQRLRVFRYGTNGSAPLQNSKPLVLSVAIQSPPRCRRCEPSFLAATSLPPPEFTAHSRFV